MAFSNPRIGVGVFVLNSTGQFLLGERKGSIGSGTWALPGGHLEYGESFEECAEREVKEETDLEVEDLRFLTATNDVMENERRHYVTIFMVCRLKQQRNGEINDDDTIQVRVMEPDKCAVWEWVCWDDLVRWADDKTAAQDHVLFSPMIALIRQRPGVRPQ